jgi:hypothetical protein
MKHPQLKTAAHGAQAAPSARLVLTAQPVDKGEAQEAQHCVTNHLWSHHPQLQPKDFHSAAAGHLFTLLQNLQPLLSAAACARWLQPPAPAVHQTAAAPQLLL